MANALIVDDDHDLVEAIAEIVILEGHEARIASNGGEGLDRVYERRPDIILLDVEMPVLDGPGMVRRLPSREGDEQAIPIVLLSGRNGLARIAETLETPYFLRKPFAMDALVAVIETALQERSRRFGGAAKP